MKRHLKITLIILACLVAFQMFFRYDIKRNFLSGGGFAIQLSVIDRLTGKHYQLLEATTGESEGRAVLFPWPHQYFIDREVSAKK